MHDSNKCIKKTVEMDLGNGTCITCGYDMKMIIILPDNGR